MTNESEAQTSQPNSLSDLMFYDWSRRTWYGKLRLAIAAPMVYAGLTVVLAAKLAARAVRNAWPSVYKEGEEPDDQDQSSSPVTGFEPNDSVELDWSVTEDDDE